MINAMLRRWRRIRREMKHDSFGLYGCSGNRDAEIRSVSAIRQASDDVVEPICL
jgi:hypothetical protein